MEVEGAVSPVRPEFNYHMHNQQWLKVERNCGITR